MPKAKKSSNKDTSDFIKKVASAGRGGDTELAHLSPKARELLKKLGGAGTKNPKTKLKEYRVARESGVSPFAEELLEESNPAEQEAARAAQEQAVAERPEVMVRPQKQDSVEAFIREQEERDRVPRTEDDEPITAPGSAADNLSQFTGTSPTTTLTPEQLAELTRINAAGFGNLTTGINLSGIGLGGSYMPGGPGPRPEEGDLARLRDAQLLREAQEEEARRRAVEEEARRRAAAEEAARRVAEEAARKEAARLVAEEAARRTAEEQARRIAEQDIQARRAADEARRVGEEAQRRQLAEEAARRAAEEEARRRAEEEKNRPPTTGGPGEVTLPPGLINSPLPPNPPISPPTTGGGTVPGGGGVQTADFINRPARSPSGINYGFFGDDTDIGRLLNSVGGGRGRVPGGPSDVKIPELPPISGGFPTPTTRPLPDTGAPPPAYPSGGGGSYPSTPSVPPGYQAAPLPVMPGAGTGTPFFNPASGGLMPGTIPASQIPQSLQTSNIPLQAIEANPNLSPTVLGGTQNLGYYTDRFGNVILSPGAVKPTGRKKGGPSNQEELMELLRERNEADGYGDLDSARSMLEGLSRAPASSKTEVSLSPNAQSVRRTSRTPIRQDSERGSARGMAMELEEITQSKDQAPRTKRQTREAQQKMELVRETLGMPTFSQASLSRAGDLMAKNFNEGGEAKKELGRLKLPPDRSKGFREEGIEFNPDAVPAAQIRTYLNTLGGEAKSSAREKLEELIDATKKLFSPEMSTVPKPGPGTRRYFEERGMQLSGSPPDGIEREAQIRAQIGPEYVDLVEKNIGVTGMVGNPKHDFNLRGVNFSPTSSPRLLRDRVEFLEPVLSASGDNTLPKGKRIFGVARNAVPQTYAHEIRHEEVRDEEQNRMLDLVNAGSRPAYQNRIDSLYDFYMSEDPLYTEGSDTKKRYLDNKILFEDKEQYVLNKVAPVLGEYLTKEAPSKEGSSKDVGKNTLRSNYNLNAMGAIGAYRESGEQLEKSVIEQRARYPFLNFIGRENMPTDRENFLLPNYLDYELQKIQPKSRATGSPSTGETSADLYRSLLKSSDLSRSIPTSPPSGSSKDSKKSQEDLRKLILAMNPDAQGIEEAVAGAPKTSDATKRAGKGFYEANVAPLLSPIETAKGLVNLAGEFATNPYRTTIDVVGAERDRLNKTRESSGDFAEYLGGFVNPFSRVLRAPRTEVVRPKGQGVVLDYPDAPSVPIGNKDLELDEVYGTTRFPKGFVNRTIENGQERLKTLNASGEVNLDQSVAIDEFLRTKSRNYFVNQFGTKDDPIFKAIKEGRLSTVKLREPGGIRSYLPRDAKEGKARINPETNESTFYPTSAAKEALEDINKIYDEMTGMRGTVIANRTVGRPDYEHTALNTEFEKSQKLLNETSEALVAEGNRPFEINPSVGILGYKDPTFAAELPPKKRLLNITPFEGRSRSSVASADIAALMLAQQENLPKSLRMAIEKGQPIYDMSPSKALKEILAPEPLVDYLATLSPREIKNLRYEDAVRGASKLNELRTQRKAVIMRIEEGKPVDNKIFMEGVSAPIIKYDEKTQFPGFTWRRITDAEATTVEGAYIGHSVGGYAKEGMYSADSKKDFKSGATKVYTLRDAEGKPVTTVEVKEIEGRDPIVTQVRGAGKKSGNLADKTPYDTALVDLFNDLKVARITENNLFLPPLSSAYKQQLDSPTSAARSRLAVPQILRNEDAPQVQQGIGQLPNAPQNLPNEGRIRATLRRLGID